MKRTLSLVCLLYVLALVNGHGYFSSITVDGTAYKEGDCTRPHPSSEYDYPISQKDRPNGLQTNDMTCGWLPAAAKSANRKCPVQPGSAMAYQFHYEMGMGASDTYIIAPDHRGPCIIYMANSETGSGPVWFKIFEDGYNQNTKLWCVDKLRAAKGRLNFTIPADLAPGNYLIRAEIIALHEGFELYGAQPYVGCAEVTVGGSFSGKPAASQIVSFPGAYTATDPGILFDIYTGKNPAYPIPGPTIYKAGSTASGTATGSTSTTGPAVQSLTTAKPASVTTGKKTSSNNKITTGMASNTYKVTTGVASNNQVTTAASSPSGTGTVPATGSPCPASGNMLCVTSETYQSCANGVWQAAQSCNSGTTCRQTGNVVYCY